MQHSPQAPSPIRARLIGAFDGAGKQEAICNTRNGLVWICAFSTLNMRYTRLVDVSLGGWMTNHGFDFGATVEMTLFSPRTYWRDLLRAAKWPAIAFVPAFAFYFFVVVYFLGDQAKQQQGMNADSVGGFLGFMGVAYVGIIPIALVAVAFFYNWQRFLMLGDIEAAGSTPRTALESVSPGWWTGYRHYLTKLVMIWAIFTVPYVIMMVWMFGSLDTLQTQEGVVPPDLASTLAPFFAFMLLIVLLMPYAMRAQLVFPAIAADLPEATFRNVFGVSRGLGWRMAGAYMVTILAMILVMFVVMIGVMILVAIGAALGQVVGTIVVIVGGALAMATYVVVYLGMAAVYAGFSAIVLMQLLPDFHQRWKDLSGGGGSTTDGSHTANDPEHGERTPSYGRRKRDS